MQRGLRRGIPSIPAWAAPDSHPHPTPTQAAPGLAPLGASFFGELQGSQLISGDSWGLGGEGGGVGREERGGGRGTLAGRLGLGGKGARPSQPRGLQRIANCN